MPYIEISEREFWHKWLNQMPRLTTIGEVNYLLTQICQRYLQNGDGIPNYRDYNAVIGALECCKQELYRRLVIPYEDQKIIENGDVYDGI